MQVLVAASLSRRFHIVGSRRVIRSITRACVICRRLSAKPRPQMLGQLPLNRLTPGLRVGVDYTGPVTIKSGYVRKPTFVKAYVCVFVSLSTKAVHLELVSDLTSEAFIATLRRFIACRGKPSCIWSDNGTNFVGAAREPKELFEFLGNLRTQRIISEFCSSQHIIHSRTCTPFRQSLGSCCEEYEDSLAEDYCRREADVQGVHHSSDPSQSVPQFPGH